MGIPKYLDYLLKTGSYNDFTQQPFYVKIEGSGRDKTYNLIGISGGVVENLSSKCPQKVKSDYAKAHILLYKEMYDPLIKSLNSMIKQGQGFNNVQENQDHTPF